MKCLIAPSIRAAADCIVCGAVCCAVLRFDILVVLLKVSWYAGCPALQRELVCTTPTCRRTCAAQLHLTVSRSSICPTSGSPLRAQAASSNPPDIVPHRKKSGGPELPFFLRNGRCLCMDGAVWPTHSIV